MGLPLRSPIRMRNWLENCIFQIEIVPSIWVISIWVSISIGMERKKAPTDSEGNIIFSIFLLALCKCTLIYIHLFVWQCICAWLHEFSWRIIGFLHFLTALPQRLFLWCEIQQHKFGIETFFSVVYALIDPHIEIDVCWEQCNTFYVNYLSFSKWHFLVFSFLFFAPSIHSM